MYTLYPSFHKNRPRFFNMVTLYRLTVQSLDDGLVSYFKKHFKITTKGILNSVELAYENYVEWEANGGQELRLSAFKLTNRQMFWFSLVHRTAAKYQKNIPNITNFVTLLQNKFIHVRMKSKKEFRDDYQCEDMTTSEKQENEKFIKELAKLIRQNNH